MGNLGSFEVDVINKMISKFPLGYPEAVRVLKLMEASGLITKSIKSDADVNDLINNEISNYLMPKGFFRFKQYSVEELESIGIKLQLHKEKNDGWGTKIYYDSKNDLYWEDAPGRYTNEGFQISTDLSPISSVS